MANEPINYKAVLADLEAKKAQIESAIAAIKMIAAQGGTLPPGSSKPEPSAFLKMSIPDATKKLLEHTRQKHSTQAVIDALVAGGLPKSKYTTVYSILRRRERQVGDLINMQGDWALAEWYPNYRKGKSSEETDSAKKPKAKRGRPRKSKETSAETAPTAVAASAA